jgi:hypothetical protein
MSTADVIALAGVVIAALALIVAFVAMIWQAKQTHASNSISNLWRFLDEWDSQQMHRIRVKACGAIKEKRDSDDIPDLLSFFEELGFLVRQRALDADAAWAMFSAWVLPYWRATRYYVEDDQRNDATYWENFQYLNKKLIQIEASRRHKPVHEIEPSDSDVKKLLDVELALNTDDESALGLVDNVTAVAGAGAVVAGRRTFSPWRRRRATSRRTDAERPYTA